MHERVARVQRVNDSFRRLVCRDAVLHGSETCGGTSKALGRKLVYRVAIDNSPDGEGGSPQGGKLVNYVDAALEDLAAGRPVQTAETKAYGCGVKYSN